MIKLETVIIQNFLSVEQQIIDFSDLGLCLVNGINGSGKSSIYRSAVEYLLFGVVPEKLRGDDFLSDFNKKDLMVNGLLTRDNDSINIIRYRNHQEFKNKLILIVNGNNVSLTDNRETQAKINTVLGIDFETFESSTCFNNNAILFAESTSANRTALLSKILYLSKYSEALEKVKQEVVEVKSEIEFSQHDIISYENSISKGESTLNSLKAELKNFDKEKEKELNKLRRAKAKLEHDLKPKIDLLVITKDLDTSRENLAEVQKKVTQSRVDSIKITSKLEEYEEEGNILEVGKECNTCKRIMTLEHVSTRGSFLRNKINDLSIKAKNIHNMFISFQNEEKKLDAQMHALFLKREGVVTFNHTQDMKQAEIVNIDKQIANTDKPNTSIIKYIETTKSEIETSKLEHLEATRELRDFNDRLKYLEFWAIGFGRAGIPNLIIEKSLSRLEEYTNRYLSGTGISLTLTSQKQLKSKKEKREEIDIIILNNGIERNYNNLSSGEKRRVDIALLFAICDLGVNRFNLMILDEVLDSSLDSAGADIVLDILRRKSNDLDSLIVISHQPHLQDNFDNCITVTKSRGRSTVS